MARAAWVLVALAGCRGLFGLDQPAHRTDAAIVDGDGNGTIDASDAPADARLSCMDRWLTKTPAFDAPVPLAGINSGNPDITPARISSALMFSTDRTGGSGALDVWYATVVGGTLTTTGVMPNLNTASNETRFTVTESTFIGVLESDRPGGSGATDLWQTTRAGLADPFAVPSQTHLALINTGGQENDPAISADGLELFFVRNQIWAATRATVTDDFGAPAMLSELGTSNVERDPAPAADPRVLVLASNLPGGPGGSGDMWFAVRAGRGQPFSTPILVPTVNTTFADVDPWLSLDGCTLYFTTNRDGGQDLYSATMPDPF